MIQDLATTTLGQLQLQPRSPLFAQPTRPSLSTFNRAAQAATARALNLSPFPDPSPPPDEQDLLGIMFRKLRPTKLPPPDSAGKPSSPSPDGLLLHLHEVDLNDPRDLKRLAFFSLGAQELYNEHAPTIALTLKRTADDPKAGPSKDLSFRHCANMTTAFRHVREFLLNTIVNHFDPEVPEVPF